MNDFYSFLYVVSVETLISTMLDQEHKYKIITHMVPMF